MSGHRWVKAPRSLFALFMCRVCGATSMAKHYGRCLKADSPASEPDIPIRHRPQDDLTDEGRAQVERQLERLISQESDPAFVPKGK